MTTSFVGWLDTILCEEYLKKIVRSKRIFRSENITRYIKGKIPKDQFLTMLSHEEPTHQICFCTVDSLLMLEIKDNSNDIDYEVSEIGGEIIKQLIFDFNFDEEKSADLFFTSETFRKLSNTATKLYKKDWTEIYKLLKQELK